ncbi:hypothetical protein SprV_0100163100 [Sparganum proliferum]
MFTEKNGLKVRISNYTVVTACVFCILGPEKWAKLVEEKSVLDTACFVLRTREPAVSGLYPDVHPQGAEEKVESTESPRDELFSVSRKDAASGTSSGATPTSEFRQSCKLLTSYQDMLTFTLPVETCSELGYYEECLRVDEGRTAVSKLLLDVNSLKLKAGTTSRVTPPFTTTSYLAILTRRLQERLMDEVDKWLQRLEGTLIDCDSEFFRRTQQEADAHLKFLSTAGKGPLTQAFEAYSLLDKTEEWTSDLMIKGLGRECTCIEAYLRRGSTSPLLIFGMPGTGKSSLLRYALRKFQEIERSDSAATTPPENQPVVVARSARRSACATTLQSLIDSIIHQVHLEYRSDLCENPKLVSICEYAELVRTMANSLHLPSSASKLLVLIDDLDLLYPSSHVELFRWIPHQLPRSNVRFIMSTSNEAMAIAFKARYGDGSCITVAQGPSFTALKSTVLPSPMNPTVQSAVQENTAPLFVHCLLDLNETALEDDTVPHDIATAFRQRLRQLQVTFESSRKCLSDLLKITKFLAYSRTGLALAELSDLLELENQDAATPIGSKRDRTPVGHVLRLLCDRSLGLADYLACIKDDQRIVYSLSSEQYREGAQSFWEPEAPREPIEAAERATEEQSLPSSQIIHTTLFRYWTGSQVPRQKSPLGSRDSTHEYEYFWVNPTRTSSKCPQNRTSGLQCKFNLRMLTEVPFQLVNSTADIVDIHYELAFRFDFMFGCLGKAGHMNDLISGLYFLRQLPQLQNNSEFDLLLHLLRGLSQKLTLEPRLLSVEIVGRIGHLAGSKFTNLGQTLLSSIDNQANRINCLQALLPTMYSPVMQPELTRVVVDCEQNVFLSTISPDNRFLVTIVSGSSDEDDEQAAGDRVNGESRPSTDAPDARNQSVVIWDVRNITKVQIFSIGKWPRYTFRELLYPPSQEEYILLKYTQTDENGKKLFGLIVININQELVENTYVAPEGTEVQIVSITKSKIMLIAEELKEEEKTFIKVLSIPDFNVVSQHLKRVPAPCLIVNAERYIIGPSSWVSENYKKADVNQLPPNCLQIRPLSSPREPVCRLDCPGIPQCLASGLKGDAVFVGMQSKGSVCRFDLNQLIIKEARRIRPNLELKLAETLQEVCVTPDLLDRFAMDSNTLNTIRARSEQLMVRSIRLSTDDYYLLAEYDVTGLHSLFCVWNLATKQLAAVFTGYPDSHFRFGMDPGAGELLHFAPSSFKFSGIEIVSLTYRSDPSTSRDSVKRQQARRIFTIGSKCITDARFVRGGKILICAGGELILAANAEKIAALDIIQPGQYLGCELNWPVFLPTLDIAYSTDVEPQKPLDLLNLHVCQKQFIVSENKALTDDLLEDLIGESIVGDTPKEYYFSSNGRFVALVYYLNLVGISSETRVAKFRKPEISGVNYFTAAMEGINGSPRLSLNDRKVVRVYGSVEGMESSPLFCTISLCGETVLALSAKNGLLTVKPDPASEQNFQTLDRPRSWRKAQAVLSRYSLITGEFDDCTYIPHPVIPGSRLVDKESFLFVCCGTGGGELKLLRAPNFQRTEYEVEIGKYLHLSDDFARNPDIQRVFCCEKAPSVAVIYYTWEATTSTHYYARVDISKRLGETNSFRRLPVGGQLCDLSDDGTMAIDTNMNLINAVKGEVIHQLVLPVVPGLKDVQEVRWRAKISTDRACIAAVSCRDNGEAFLVVIKNDDSLDYPIVGIASLQPIIKAPLTVTNPEDGCLPEVNFGGVGRVICVTLAGGKELKAFLIREPTATPVMSGKKYSGPEERIQFLLRRVLQTTDPREGLLRSRAAEQLSEVVRQLATLL